MRSQPDRAAAELGSGPKWVAQDAPELVRRLTERNREITEGERDYAPFH